MHHSKRTLAYKMRGQRDAAQKEMEEVGRELRGDDEELRVRFRKGFCV